MRRHEVPSQCEIDRLTALDDDAPTSGVYADSHRPPTATTTTTSTATSTATEKKTSTTTITPTASPTTNANPTNTPRLGDLRHGQQHRLDRSGTPRTHKTSYPSFPSKTLTLHSGAAQTATTAMTGNGKSAFENHARSARGRRGTAAERKTRVLGADDGLTGETVIVEFENRIDFRTYLPLILRSTRRSSPFRLNRPV